MKKNLDEKFRENRQNIEMDVPNPKLNAEADRLLLAAKNMERSSIEEYKKRAKLATRFAFGSLAISMAMAGVLLVAMPFKTVEPYLIKVDSTTGFTQVSRPLSQSVDPSESLTKYFINMYVISRESYDWNSIQSDFSIVQAMSSEKVFSAYDVAIRDNNGPLKVFEDSKRAVTTVENTSFINDEMAQVRFVVNVYDRNGKLSTNYPARRWIATLTYDYAKEKRTESQRLLNPLDFKVTSYRVDEVKGSY